MSTDSDDLPLGLPPLDGDSDGDPEVEDQLDDDAMPKEDGADPFDDATGEGDAPDLAELDGLDDDAESMLDAVPSEGLDIGAHDLVAALESPEGLTDLGPDDERPHEDYGLGDDRPSAALDAGEEGPETDDESLSDAGLPPLEQDDDGTQDDAESFFDGDLSGTEKAPHRPVWSSPWERFGAPLSLAPSRALARVRGGVIAGGRELVRVDLEGATERLGARGLRGGETTHVLVSGGHLLATTERGGLFVSHDDGASFAELAAWREHVRPEEAAAGLEVVVAGDGGLWGRTALGSLLVSVDHGERWEKADVDGFVHALGTDDVGGVVALVRGLAASEVLRRATGDAGWSRTAVPGEVLSHRTEGTTSLVAFGSSVAIAIEGDGVLRSMLGGWSRLPAVHAPTAMVMLDAAGALVVAVQGTEDDEAAPVARLVHIGPDDEPRVVAVWEEQSEGEVGISAIAVDDAHEVVWVGGSFGVAAFQPKMG